MNKVKAIAVETIVIDGQSTRSTRVHHHVVCTRLPLRQSSFWLLEVGFGTQLLIEDDASIAIHLVVRSPVESGFKSVANL